MLVCSAVSVALQVNTSESWYLYTYPASPQALGSLEAQCTRTTSATGMWSESIQPKHHHTDDSAVDYCGLRLKQLAELAELVLIAHTHCSGGGGGGSPEPEFTYLFHMTKKQQDKVPAPSVSFSLPEDL